MAESVKCNEVLSESGDAPPTASQLEALPVTKRFKDERCFVTNCPRPGIKHTTYLIDARPSPEDESPEDKARKKTVDRLKAIGVVHSTFHLEHKSNRIMLDPMIRHSIQVYDYCAIVPSKECLLRMTELVLASNVIWAEDRLKNPGCARKPFNLLDAALVNPEYQFVILYPYQMLQRATMTVYLDEIETPADGPMFYLNYYFIDGAMRVLRPGYQPSNGDVTPLDSSSSPPIFGPFRRRHNRENPSHNSNPFLHVLSAHIALRRYRRALALNPEESFAPLCPEYKMLIDLTCRLAELIYFDEEPTTGVQGLETET